MAEAMIEVRSYGFRPGTRQSEQNRESSSMDWNELRRNELERLFRRHTAAEVRFDRASRILYSTDASIYQVEPAGVLIPRSKDDLLAAVGIAAEQHVSLVPRGGGTSLSGQSIGPGVVVDCSKYLNRILEVNLQERWARVEPGVVLAALNQHLAPMGYQFGPDVATIDRANLGGMIGSNSAGARSLKYGKTVDHVIDLATVLANGQEASFGPLDEQRLAQLRSREDHLGTIYRTVCEVVEQCRPQIVQRYPKVLRRVSGYNLDALLGPSPPNLAHLIVGSEGTLATVSSAKLNIVPLPSHRAIATVHFATLDAALRALTGILTTDPCAVELIDQMILDLARGSAEYRRRIAFVEGQPAALFLVEYAGHDASDIDRGFAELRRVLSDQPVQAILETRDPQQCEWIWSVRKLAVPLLLAMPGRRKPLTFVEDTAVSPEQLPEFVARFQDILARHGTDASFYGHASVGCLHIRPRLDLHTRQGRRDLASIADQVVDLVLEFGGALSGEHGDGLCRSAFNERLFGKDIYSAFGAIKRAFDPDGLMNPGKVVGTSAITSNLRVHTRTDRQLTTSLSFESQGGIVPLVEGCNGNALCRRQGTGTMCPSYMATREEEHSPRGRANLLRATFEGRAGAEPGRSWITPELDEALSLCLMCKACKTECPSSVDVAKLKAEYLQQSYRRRRPSLRVRLMADVARGNRLGSRLAPLSGWLLRSWPMRWLLDHFLGIDHRRKLPAFYRQTLVAWFLHHDSLCRRARGKVVLLADCFTNHHEPKVGRYAVQLLESSGYQVHLADICCGRAMISKGFLDRAKGMIAENIERLIGFAEEGTPILGIEPGCLFTLTDEWPALLPGEATTLIASRVQLVETWLAECAARGASDLPAPHRAPAEVLVHGHCHLKAAGALAGSVAALERLAGIQATVLDSGCCGMAGSFGYEKEHYDLSAAIAAQRLLPALSAAPEATVVASGFSCRCQIRDLADRRAVHPLELIHERVLPP